MGQALVHALRMAAAMRTDPRPVKLRKWPRPRWPHGPRLEYYRVLLQLVEAVQRVVLRDLVPKLPSILGAHNAQRPEPEAIRTDATGTEVDDAFVALHLEAERVIPEHLIEMVAQKNALRVTEFNGNELQKQIQRVAKVNLFDSSTGLAQHLDVFVSDNVALVKSLAFGQLEDLKGIVMRGARQGLHHTEVAKQLVDRFGMAKKRAALIATDQVGKLNGELNSLRQQNIGVRRYRWSSSKDERVRHGHRVLEGTIQLWTKPPVVDQRTGERAHPGQPIRCRCAPIPIIDDVLVDAGLMDPADVELGQPIRGPQTPFKAPPQPLPKVPPTLPQPPPANVVPAAPPLATKVRKARSASPKPPSAPTNTAASNLQLLNTLSTEMGALGPRGNSNAEKVRRPLRGLLAGQGMQETPGHTGSNSLVAVSRPGGNAHFLACHRSDGRMEVRTDVFHRLNAGLRALARGNQVTHEEIDAVITLVHEEIHGMGASRALGSAKMVGLLVEETATETMARLVTRELVAAGPRRALATDHPLALPRKTSGPNAAWQVTPARAYDKMLAGVLDDIESTTGWTPGRVTTALETAARTFKQRGASLNAKEDYATAFAAAVPGLTPAQRIQFTDKLIARGLTY